MPAGDAGGANVKDMTGHDFCGATVLRRHGSKKRLATWLCRCSCGNTFVAVGADIRGLKTKTCGCRRSVANRRNWQGFGGIGRGHWMTIYQNAERRRLAFTITIEHAWSLFVAQNSVCVISGLPISLSRNCRTASLDRIDNDNGYIYGNVQWVHKDINKLRGVFTVERFMELCKLVADYNT